MAELPEAATALGIPGARDHDLWDAVGRLPSKQRQVITYRYLAGMGYAQIAAVVGGSAEAARRASADGLKTLRRTYPGAIANGAEL